MLIDDRDDARQADGSAITEPKFVLFTTWRSCSTSPVFDADARDGERGRYTLDRRAATQFEHARAEPVAYLLAETRIGSPRTLHRKDTDMAQITARIDDELAEFKALASNRLRRTLFARAIGSSRRCHGTMTPMTRFDMSARSLRLDEGDPMRAIRDIFG